MNEDQKPEPIKPNNPFRRAKETEGEVIQAEFTPTDASERRAARRTQRQADSQEASASSAPVEPTRRASRRRLDTSSQPVTPESISTPEEEPSLPSLQDERRKRRLTRLHTAPESPRPQEEGNIATNVELQGLKRRKDKGRGRILLPEEYAGMHAEIERASSPSRCFVVGVTSAVYGEGKTTIAMNLAGTMAQNSVQRVALVDGNLRNWDLQLRLNLPPCVGLVDYLEGKEDDLDNIIQHTELENFVLIPAGRAAINPSRLSRSPRLMEFMNEMRMRYDFVIFDMAPILPVADARVLSSVVDEIIIVVRAGITPREIVSRAIETIGSDRVHGVVLNGTETSMPRFLQRYFL